MRMVNLLLRWNFHDSAINSHQLLSRKLCFFERWIRRELSNLTSLQQVTCIVQLQLIRILFSCFEIVVGEICHFLMGTLNSWIGLKSCQIIMLCSGAEQVTLTIPFSAQRCNIYELQQTATVSNCLGNSSIPHCALANYYKIENFFCIHLCTDQANQGGSTTINFKDHKYCQMGVSLAHLKVRFYCKP